MKCSSGRKALQPRNIFFVDDDGGLVKKPKQEKGNLIVPVVVEAPTEIEIEIDASLAEELSAFKKKLERLREDRERTEKVLKGRDGAMDAQMAHLLRRGDTQKSLEIQVDRLFRLKELHAYSSKISPIRSLRAKEQGRRKRFSFEPEDEEESSVNKAVADEPEEEDSSVE